MFDTMSHVLDYLTYKSCSNDIHLFLLLSELWSFQLGFEEIEQFNMGDYGLIVSELDIYMSWAGFHLGCSNHREAGLGTPCMGEKARYTV